MKRWEYRIIVFEDGTEAARLDEAGEQGWEAYAVVVIPPVEHEYDDLRIAHYFKRRLPEESREQGFAHDPWE